MYSYHTGGDGFLSGPTVGDASSMHGNTPHAGSTDVDVTPEHRRALRRELADIAKSTRALLPDDFVVGAEISDGSNGLRATVAVQPPVGHVVSAGFAPDGDADATALARDLAAGAVLEAKHAPEEIPRAAQ